MRPGGETGSTTVEFLAAVVVLAIVTIPESPREMTANLLAPLVVDCRSREGRQLILDAARFTTRHRLIAEG